jgi:hypothetical protein
MPTVYNVNGKEVEEGTYWELNVFYADGSPFDFYFDTEVALDKFVELVKSEVTADNLEARLYKQYHPHNPDFEDCRCTQFLTDLNPFWKNEVNE